MENFKIKPPNWYFALAIILLVWNIMGLYAFFEQITMSGEQLAAMPDNERTMYENVPLWATVAFAIAVIGGTLGCIGLIMRRSWARRMFVLSVIGIVFQMIYNLFIGGTMELYGPGAIAMPVMVLLIGIFLIWFAGYSQRKGWLR